MIEIRHSADDWWYVECDCGYYTGPFDAKEDAFVDSQEHDCPPHQNGENQ